MFDWIAAQNCSTSSCIRSAPILRCAGIVTISGTRQTSTKSAQRSRRCITTGFVASFMKIFFPFTQHDRSSGTRELRCQALVTIACKRTAHSALLEDSSLYVVPGSHRVPRTPAQRALSSDTMAPSDPLAMPGATRVTLKRTISEYLHTY